MNVPIIQTMMRWAYTLLEEGHYDLGRFTFLIAAGEQRTRFDLDPYRVNRLCNGDPDDAEWRRLKQAAPSVGDWSYINGICYSRLKGRMRRPTIIRMHSDCSRSSEMVTRLPVRCTAMPMS